VPEKFIAFSGPAETRHSSNGYLAFTPHEYAPILKKWGVTCVVQLNIEKYDKRVFAEHGTGMDGRAVWL